MSSLPFEAIIFDHDGTLVDTESPDLRGCQLLYAELGAPFNPEKWAEFVAGSMDGYTLLFNDLIKWKGNGLTHDSLMQRLRQLWQATFEQVELVPGVTSLLSRLRAAGYPLAVASSSDRRWLERWLTRFDLQPYFRVIASGDDVANVKPAPDVYLWAAEQLGVKPTRCLVFEDTLTGVQAAKSAGMTVIAVPGAITRRLNFCQANKVLDNFNIITPEWLVEFAKHLMREKDHVNLF